MIIKKQNTIYEDRNPISSDNLNSMYSLGTRWINNLTGKEYRHITDGVWVLEISQIELDPLVSLSHEQNTDSQLKSPDQLHTVSLDNGGTLHVENISQFGSAYETHAEQVYTTSDNIILRDGATVGLATGEYTGFKAKLYDGINDGELVFDKDGWARVGDVGYTKKIATITDNFSTNYIPKWNGTSFTNSLISDDGVKLIISGGVGVGGDVSATGFLLNGNNLTSSLSTNNLVKWNGSSFVDATAATSVSDGYLKYQDWNNFNNKQPAGDYATNTTVNNKVDKVTGKSLIADTEIAKLQAYPTIPVTPAGYVLSDDGTFKPISAGATDTAANLYASNVNSATGGYKELSYSVDVAQVIKTITANAANGIVYGEKYLFPSQYGEALINSGQWQLHSTGFVDSATGVSRIVLRIFKYSIGGVETELFVKQGEEINNTVAATILVDYESPNITVLSTDRIGFQIGFVTTSTPSRTLSYYVGNGDATHINAPFSARHSRLRAKNEELVFQHVDTTTEKNTNDNNKIVVIENNAAVTMSQDTFFADLIRATNHNNRIIGDLGAPSTDVQNEIALLKFYESMEANIKLFYCPHLTGNKYRESGNLKFISKGYDASRNKFDLTQTNLTSQPYLSGNIAPNEKLGLKNPNGGNNYMTHPTISFGATDAWSVTTVLNFNGTNAITDSYVGGLNSAIRIKDTANTMYLVNSNSLTTALGILTNNLIGKNKILTIVSDGVGNIKVFIDGVVKASVAANIDSSFTFDLLCCGRSKTIFSSSTISAHIIRSQALTQQQVTAEYNLLRSYYPEIPNVAIGTQTWATSNFEAVCTPQGTLIPEVQANGNVEKITNIADREFSSDTGFWSKFGNASIVDGVCRFTNAGATNSIYKTVGVGVIGRYFKIVYSISNHVSGGITPKWYQGSVKPETANGTYTVYTLCTDVIFAFSPSIAGTTLDIDNVSVQEVGWSGSQELYDGIYAQTIGTVEQKTYAAVKAAAMWCHYNNDVAIGAVYGKLYNWFAVKLFQMDIDYYNSANPTTPWGWRIPTQTDFTTLSTYFGGDAVSGGKLKKEGFTHWNSPNTGADNSSGFSALGIGLKNPDGTFGGLKNLFRSWSISEMGVYGGRLGVDASILTCAIDLIAAKTYGYAIRLIKA